MSLSIEEHEVSTEDVVESLRTLAEQIEMASDIDASVVCIIRVDDNVRLYALGDDLNTMIAEASAYLDGAVQSLMLQNRTVN